jgi:hypothetical protein
MGKNPDLLIKYNFLRDHYDDLMKRRYGEAGDGIHRIRNKAQIDLLEFIFKNGKRTDMNIRLRDLENKFESNISECAEIGLMLSSLMRKARKFHKINKKHFLYPKYLQLLKDVRLVRVRVGKEINK